MTVWELQNSDEYKQQGMFKERGVGGRGRVRGRGRVSRERER